MDMHRGTTFALGALAGAAVAVALATAVGSATSGTPVPPSDARSAPIGRGEGNDRLGARAAAPAAEGSAAGTAAERFERWYTDATTRAHDARGVRTAFWLGLVRAYAAAGLGADLARACDRALEAGVPPGTLLEALREAGRSPDLKGLLARHPDARWDLRSRLETGDRDPAPLLEALRAKGEALRALREGRPVPGGPANAPGLPDVLGRLAEIDPARAAAEAEALAAAWPTNADLLRDLAEGLRANPEASLAFVRRGLDVVPFKGDLLGLFMDLDLTAATAYLESGVAKDPSSLAGWDALALALERTGDSVGVARALARAADLDPTCDRLQRLAALDAAAALPRLAAATEGPGARDAALWGLRAEVELRAGSAQAAFDAWAHRLSLDPASVYDDALPGWIAFDPARVAEILAPSAERAFAKEDDAQLQVYATALVDARDPRAFDVARRALEKGIWWGGMPALLARADPVAALPILEARQAAGPVDADLLEALGEAYLGARRRADAVATFERALGSLNDNEDGSERVWVGIVRADPQAGLARLRQHVSEMDPTYGAALLGDALAALGRTAEARAAYERAISAEPEAARWRVKLAALR